MFTWTPRVGENLRRKWDISYGDNGPLSQIVVVPSSSSLETGLLVSGTTGLESKVRVSKIIIHNLFVHIMSFMEYLVAIRKHFL